MKPLEAPCSNLTAVHRWQQGIGVAAITIWRWRKNGWLHTVNINGKLYVSAQEIANFERRATAGEFEKLARVPKTNRN